jgi:heme/copper-type cytochrome/quinol oxidase subunit 2
MAIAFRTSCQVYRRTFSSTLGVRSEPDLSRDGVLHPLQQITARSLRVAVVVFVFIIVIFAVVFVFVFVFLFLLVWLLSKQDIGTHRPIEGSRVAVFWMFSAHI